jgi:ferredoxin-NADP reductase/ferredoxin
LRVLEEGNVLAGEAIELISRDEASVTVADVDALLYRPRPDRAKVRQALQVPALSPGWRMSLQAILDQPPGTTGNPGLASTDLSVKAKPGFRTARITLLSRITADVMAVSFEAADGSELDPAEPGQFIVVKAPPFMPSPAIMRSYSLTGTPNNIRYDLGVKCEPNGSMGRYFSQRARVGDTVEMSAPRGSFVLRSSARPAIFISAGIGITPVLAMLRSLVAERSPRNVWWLYGARNSAEHPFAAEVRALLSGLSNAKSHFRYSRPSDVDRIGRDFDSLGRLDAALVAQLGINTDSEFYLCGPLAFMSDMKTGLAATGVPSEQIHSEVFGAGPALTPGIVKAPQSSPHEPAGAPGSGPVVSFARSGLNVPWNSQYGSLLEFAEACAVPTRWSCRAGVCHTCESGLISGAVSYDPEPLEAPGNGNVLVCCSTPKSELVLDL